MGAFEGASTQGVSRREPEARCRPLAPVPASRPTPGSVAYWGPAAGAAANCVFVPSPSGAAAGARAGLAPAFFGTYFSWHTLVSYVRINVSHDPFASAAVAASAPGTPISFFNLTCAMDASRHRRRDV